MQIIDTKFWKVEIWTIVIKEVGDHVKSVKYLFFIDLFTISDPRSICSVCHLSLPIIYICINLSSIQCLVHCCFYLCFCYINDMHYYIYGKKYSMSVLTHTMQFYCNHVYLNPIRQHFWNKRHVYNVAKSILCVLFDYLICNNTINHTSHTIRN